MKKKRKYFLGRKHKQFYIYFNENNGTFEIKPIDDNIEFMETLKKMMDDNYVFSGSYGECYAFKKGFDYGVTGYKLVVKSALKQTMELSLGINFKE